VRAVFRPLMPRQIAFDVVVAGVYVLFAAPLLSEQPIWAGIIVLLVFAAAVLLRRKSPAIALGLAWVAAIIQMAGGQHPAPLDVAVFAVLYTAAAYGDRLVFWLGFASALVGAAVATGYLYGANRLGNGLDWSSLTLAAAVYVAATFALLLAWTVGALVRTALRARANRAAQMRAEADALAEQERVRIARDMHDVVAHSLAVVIAQADGARYAATADPDAAAAARGTVAALETIATTARGALADVRMLLTQLRHSQADGPQPTIADLEALYAQVRAAGVDLCVFVDPAPQTDPPAAVQLAVYRILQEALTNALRHGSGSPVEVRLAWHPDRADLDVRNPAAPAQGESASPGHGLIGMRERAQLVGGRLDAGAEPGMFVVRASLPLGDAA